MFRTTFYNTIITLIPSDVDPTDVVKKLHDHDYLITTSPLVTRHNVQSSEPSGKIAYDVFEKIDLLPFDLWKYEIHFSCAFQDKADGVVSSIEAPMGLVSEANYTVRPAEASMEDRSGGAETGMIIEEQVESSVNALLRWFVEAQLVPARKQIHQKLIERAREEKNSIGGAAS